METVRAVPRGASVAVRVAFALWLAAAILALAGAPALVVHPLQGPALELQVEDLRDLGWQDYAVPGEDGATLRYHCVALAAVLARAGVELGKSLRGGRLQEFLLVQARDGYAAVFALPELDTAFSDRPVLLCDASGGAPLNAADGPLRLVVPGEKRHARWVRQVSDIYVQAPR